MSNGEWPTDVAAGSRSGADGGLDFGQALLHRKWLLLFFIVAGLGAGYVLNDRTHPVYRSDAALRITRYQPIGEGVATGASRNDLDTYAVLICSPQIIEKAYEDAELQRLPSLQGSNALSVIRAGLIAEPHETANEILLVSYLGEQQGDCKTILQAVITAFIDDRTNSEQSSSAGEIKLWETQRDQLRSQLRELERQYADFRVEAHEKTSGLLWTQEGGLNIHQQRLASIEEQRSSLLIEESQTRSQLEAIEAAVAAGANRDALLLMADQMDRQNTAELGPSAPSASAITSMLPLLKEKQILAEKLGAKHPKVLDLEVEIKATQEYMRQQSGSAVSAEPADLLAVYIDSLRERLKTQEQNLTRLDSLYQTEAKSSSEILETENRDRALREEIEVTKGFLDECVQQVQRIGMASQVGREQVYPSTVPTRAYQVAPVLAKSLGLGGVGGLLVGVLLAFLLEMADKSYRSPDDITRELGVPVVGHIPHIEIGRERKRLGATRQHPALVSYHRPGSQMAEAYRAVRTALLSGTRNHSHQLIQVTSPNPGDGKSTLSTNLAISIARAGKNVLLIDADLRRPNVHKLLGIDNDVGVASVVEGGADFDDAIQAGPLPHFDVMTAGPRETNRAELLLSPRFSEMLSVLRERYDYVIVDTPPVLAVSDPAAIGAMVDGVMLVLRMNRQARMHAVRARETLDLVGARLIGVVVNAIGDSSAVQGFGTGTRGYRASTYRTLSHGYSDGYGHDSARGPHGYAGYYDEREEFDRPGVHRDLAGSDYER